MTAWVAFFFHMAGVQRNTKTKTAEGTSYVPHSILVGVGSYFSKVDVGAHGNFPGLSPESLGQVPTLGPDLSYEQGSSEIQHSSCQVAQGC